MSNQSHARMRTIRHYRREAGLSRQLRLLAQRVDSGFNYQTERISEAKRDLSMRLDSVERRIEFYGRVFVGAIVGVGGVLSALSTAMVGRFMQWW